MKPALDIQRARTLGENMLRARQALGLSQRALANIADVTEKTLQSIECGRTLRPNPRTVAALAEALGVTSDALYAQAKNTPPRRRGNPERKVR